MKTFGKIFAGAALAGLLLQAGCSEANDDGDGGYSPLPDGGSAGKEAGSASDTGGGGVDTGTSSETGIPTTDASTSDHSVTTGDGGESGLVINEINGKGQDFVEIFNGGAAAVDIADWGVTEAKDGDSGLGSKKSPALFAGGSMLGPGDYAVIWGAPQDGAAAPICPATLCLQATWNVSNKSGATVYLLDPSSKTVASVPYPDDTVGTGQSWGRLPNGTGAFAINTATPGKANVGP
jgi:hypothetical protein